MDTENAVIVDVEATPARLAQEIKATKTMLERVEDKHHLKPERLAADNAYGTGPLLAWLQAREVTAHIRVRDHQKISGLLAREAFTYDARHNHYLCPQGKVLKYRTSVEATRIHTYRAKSRECRRCSLKQHCTRAPQRSLSVPFDEAARIRTAALQNTEGFQQSRRLRRKVEMLFAHMNPHFRYPSRLPIC